MPFRNQERTWLFYLNIVQLVESFGERRDLQPGICSTYAGLRDALFPQPALVALKGGADFRFKVVPNHLETGGPGRDNITLPVLSRWVGVIYHKALPGFQAGRQDELFTVAGFQHIQVDTHMGIGKAFLEERALAGSLYPDEDNGLHSFSFDKNLILLLVLHQSSIGVEVGKPLPQHIHD